jgi:Family of unknown function (DUF6247)
MMGDMSAQPVQEFDPDDPMEIMRVLPARYHDQFLADYDAAAASARRPDQYHELHQTLRLWRLRAAAYSDPDFEARLEAARSTPGHGTPIEDVVPDWAEKVEAARRRRGGG